MIISCLFQVQNKDFRFRKIQQGHANARRTAFFRGSLKANPSGPTHIMIFIGLHERGQTFQIIGLYYHACVIIENVNYSWLNHFFKVWCELWISLKEKYAEFIDLPWKFGGVLSPRNVKELVCLRDCFHLHIHLLFLRMHSQCLLTKTHCIYYCYEGIEVNLIVNCEKKFSAPYPMFDTEL